MKYTLPLLFLLLSGTLLCAQTALYKAYLGKPNVNAVCIPNYPIGDHKTIPVTMLQADDTATFNNLIKSLKALPYTKDKTGKRNQTLDEFRQFDTQQSKGTSASDKMTMDWLIGNVSRVNATMSLGSHKISFTSFNADALPGDKGFYLIYCSSATLTVLVFHCIDRDDASEVLMYIISSLAQQVGK